MVVYGRYKDFIENLFREVINSMQPYVGRKIKPGNARIEDEKGGYRIILPDNYTCKISLPERKNHDYDALAFLLNKYGLLPVVEKWMSEESYRISYKNGVISVEAKRPSGIVYEPYKVGVKNPILIGGGDLEVWILSSSGKRLSKRPIKKNAMYYYLRKGDEILSQVCGGELRDGIDLWGDVVPGGIKGKKLTVKFNKNDPIEKRIKQLKNGKIKVSYVVKQDGIYARVRCKKSENEVVMGLLLLPGFEVNFLKISNLPTNSNNVFGFEGEAYIKVGETDRQIKIKAPKAKIHFEKVVTLEEVIAKEIHAGYINQRCNSESRTSLEAEKIVITGDVFYSTIRANSVYFSPQHECACYHTDLEVNELEANNVSFSGVTIKPKDGGFMVIKASNISYKENPVTIINPSSDSEFPFDESKIKIVIDLNYINKPVSELKPLIDQYVEKYEKIFLTTKDGKTYKIFAKGYKEK
ncbi:MAG: hypothetical protein GXN99_01935 [Candidatus Nanohaloarchaeota archaeon]|nr:hypothetical protein [Candidatus Nanohaloarchaeota archaeon]